MQNITINAVKRTVLGKANSKLREQGLIPAVVYGHNTDTQSLEVNELEFIKALKQAGESTLVSLNFDGQSKPVLIHEVQNHYLTDKPIHVDFFAVNMNEKLTAKVAVHFVGESPAVKNLGGVLVKNLDEVEVESLPSDLPPHFEIDISSLNNLEDSVKVRDLKVSDKVEIKTDLDEVIAVVAAPRSDAEMAELEEKPVEADVTKVEGVAEPAPEGEPAPEAKAEKSAKGGEKE